MDSPGAAHWATFGHAGVSSSSTSSPLHCSKALIPDRAIEAHSVSVGASLKHCRRDGKHGLRNGLKTGFDLSLPTCRMEGKHGLRYGLKTGFDLSHPTNRGFFSLQGMTFSTELVMIEGLSISLLQYGFCIFSHTSKKKMLFATFGVFCKIFPQEWGDREVFCRFFLT